MFFWKSARYVFLIARTFLCIIYEFPNTNKMGTGSYDRDLSPCTISENIPCSSPDNCPRFWRCWYNINVRVFSKNGSFQYLGPKVYTFSKNQTLATKDMLARSKWLQKNLKRSHITNLELFFRTPHLYLKSLPYVSFFHQFLSQKPSFPVMTHIHLLRFLSIHIPNGICVRYN